MSVWGRLQAPPPVSSRTWPLLVAAAAARLRHDPSTAPHITRDRLQTERAIRFVGLSTALANAQDLADWLGITGPVRGRRRRHYSGSKTTPCMSARVQRSLWPACPLACLACLQGLFNFKPSVRPVPLECHIQVSTALGGATGPPPSAPQPGVPWLGVGQLDALNPPGCMHPSHVSPPMLPL